MPFGRHRMNLIEQGPQPTSPSYREIPLTQGQVALVDIADFEWLNQWKWTAQWSESNQCFYAIRRPGKSADGKRHKIWMHRLILGLMLRDEREGDHIKTGKTLDNRRANLRIANHSQNVSN